MEKKEKKYPESVVGALIINAEGKILLAKSKKWSGKYTIFGGHVEHCETLEDAVVREAKEEAGIDVKIVDKLGFDQSISEHDCYKDKHFVFMDFLCEFNGDDGEIKVNGEFENSFKWFTPEEAIKLDMPHGTRRAIEAYIEYKQQKNYSVSWKRAVADFENYKKRQAENLKDMIAFSNMNIIMQILPVLDNFYASIDHVPEEQKKSPWVTGIMHIQKQLEKVLEDNGVSEISVKIGDKFDPSVHDAIHKETEKGEKETENCKNIHPVKSPDKSGDAEGVFNRVKKVLQRGYKVEDKVIRAARVVVE